MIHEYALEPELVASWHERKRAIFFAKEFGSAHNKFDTGRVVSRYPEHWEDLVREAFKTTFGDKVTHNDRRRLDSMLSHIRERMVKRPECIWDGGKDWLTNAETAHRDRPFHAILARKNPRQNTNIMCEGDVWNDKAEHWNAPSTIIVQRYANKMAECVAPMLRCATKVLFVDPYFRANHDQDRDGDRHKKTLAEFLRTVSTRASQIKIELHTAHKVAYRRAGIDENLYVLGETERRRAEAELHQEIAQTRENEALDWETFRQECEQHLPSILPPGATLTIHRWKNRVEKLHNRYILTNIGGVLFGAGLDEGAPGATDDVVRLNRDVYSQRLRDYAGPNFAFERDGEPFLITCKK